MDRKAQNRADVFVCLTTATAEESSGIVPRMGIFPHKWRTLSIQESMETLETRELVPPFDPRRGFAAEDEWPQTLDSWPITMEDLLIWSLIGRNNILRAEELASQLLIDLRPLTDEKLTGDAVVWNFTTIRKMGRVKSLRKGMSLMTGGWLHGHQFMRPVIRSAADLWSIGIGVWDVTEHGVMLWIDHSQVRL